MVVSASQVKLNWAKKVNHVTILHSFLHPSQCYAVSDVTEETC